MNEAVVAYTSRAAEKLRRHQVVACHLSVFMHTSAHNSDLWYSNGASGSLVEATSDTAELVRLAVSLAAGVRRSGFRYAKAGVILTELVPEKSVQPALWSAMDRERRAQLRKVVDGLNLKLGRGTVSTAGEGQQHAGWKVRSVVPFASVGRHDGPNCLGQERNKASRSESSAGSPYSVFYPACGLPRHPEASEEHLHALTLALARLYRVRQCARPTSTLIRKVFHPPFVVFPSSTFNP